MHVEVEMNGTTVRVVCPFCPTDPPAPDPRLVETGRFNCPQCKRDFVALAPLDYAAAITSDRPALLVGYLLRSL